jgi:hypothetical protein
MPRQSAEANDAGPLTDEPARNTAPTNGVPQADTRLRELADHTRMFFERICEHLSEGGKIPYSVDGTEDEGALEPKPGVRPAAPRKAPTGRAYTDCIYTVLSAAARLPQLAESYTTDWTAKSRPVLPTADPSSRQSRVWAPILAWIVVRNLPWRMAPNEDLAELFDRLMLRHALADIFQSMGMEGEARWQAASEVRLLLTKISATADPIRSAAFFADPDACWLAGVNQSGGNTWFNKEQFEELLTWLQLPRLLKIARDLAEQDKPSQHTAPAAAKQALSHAVATVEQGVAHTLAAAETSRYQLEKYLASFTTPPKELTTKL